MHHCDRMGDARLMKVPLERALKSRARARPPNLVHEAPVPFACTSAKAACSCGIRHASWDVRPRLGRRAGCRIPCRNQPRTDSRSRYAAPRFVPRRGLNCTDRHVRILGERWVGPVDNNEIPVAVQLERPGVDLGRSRRGMDGQVLDCRGRRACRHTGSVSSSMLRYVSIRANNDPAALTSLLMR